MADFIVSPYAISFNSIKEALQRYIGNKTNVTWKDFYVSGAGETIIELDAAIAAFYAFHFIIGRRESYLPTAQNYASIIGGAQTLGYSASRGHNLHVYMDIIPNGTMTLPKWEVIGSYADYDVVLWEQATLNQGEPTTLHCVIGNSSVQAISISSSDLQQFTFTAPNTTDDCRLLLNSTELPSTTSIEDAMYDKWIMISNSYGALDAFYLQEGAYKYKSDDTLYLHYIEKNNLKFGALNNNNLSIDIAEAVVDVGVIEDLQEPEDKEHVRIAAPFAHEMNKVVRARKDYAKHLLQMNKNIIDVNDMDINPGLIALTYLKRQKSGEMTSLLTEYEKQQYVRDIMSMCPDGVAKAFIEDPIKVVRSLAISLWKNDGENISVNINESIQQILDKYRNKLQPMFDLDQVEHDINELPGIKKVRVDLGARDYEPNTKYKLYDVVTVNDVPYGNELQTWTMYCGKVATTSGDTEPDWASAGNIGDEVVDNNLIWQNSNKYTNSISAKWEENGEYSLYSNVNVGYTILPNCTSTTTPQWGETIIVDGNVSSNLVKTYGPKVEEWLPNRSRSVGDYVQVTNGDNINIYTVTDVTHFSGDNEPNWEPIVTKGDTITDNALTWTYQYDSWKPKYIYSLDDIVCITLKNKMYVYKCTTMGTSGTDKTVFEDGKNIVYEHDENGQILTTWALVDDETELSKWAKHTEIPGGSFIQYDYDYEYTVTITETVKESEDAEEKIIQKDVIYTTTVSKYFECTNINTITSGSKLPEWDTPDEETHQIVDNNVLWEIDTYYNSDIPYECIGKEWKEATAYTVGQNIIASDDSYTYVYRIYYTNPTNTTVTNKIYSVINYSGTTGGFEPEWDGKNVIDNDILWTQTENESQLEWEPNKQYRFGTIINTPNGYYTFSSVLGTSGSTTPNWAGITNNVVEDNNITWVKINNNTSFQLAWNEYLDLDFTSRIVG